MNWSGPALSSSCHPLVGMTLMVRMSGRLSLEVACWTLGLALIVSYVAAITSLETHRAQGLERFAQARAMEVLQPSSDEHLAGLERLSRNPQDPGPLPPVTSAAADPSLPIAVLRMASLGLEVPVYSDVSELNLNRGAGWIEGTAAPDTGGNMAVAAHRDRHFRPLKDIQVGDLLELESLTGYSEFRVSSIVIVDPEDVSVLDDTTLPTLTLVTCYPFYFIGNAPQRYIVQATAVERTGKASTSDTLLTFLPTGEHYE